MLHGIRGVAFTILYFRVMSHLVPHSNGGPQIYDQGKNLMQKLETSQTELSSTPHAPRYT